MTVITRSEKGNKLSNAEMDSNLNSLNWRHGGTLAAAATISITDEYNYFNISGSANVSGFSAKHAGYLIRVTFLSGGGTLVHNASTFVLPGNGNISWEVGDTAVFVNTSSNAWKCIDYTKQSLSPADYFTTSAVDGDLLPDTTNTRDLGSTTKKWKDLYVDGLAYIDGLLMGLTGYINAISGADTAISSPTVNTMATTYTVKGYADTVGAHAYGRVNASGAKVDGYNFSSVNSGTGIYTITMPTACSNGSYSIIAMANALNPKMVTFTITNASTFVIYTWDSAGNADNQIFSFAVFDNDQGL